ncbi:hypothetical protein F4802DRAFT_350999 [Xylaria palmicola]|nr:hypothetical protein F4802DRAFT_350999 [Xylaria palmicola]
MAGKKQPASAKSSSSKGAGKHAKPSPRAQKPTQAAGKSEPDEGELRCQQALLDVFGTTFRDVLGADDFASQLQALKAALFNRDFEGAFAREAALDVYAARWSPTRALCYGRIMRGLDGHLRGLMGDTPSARAESDSHDGADSGIGARNGNDGHNAVDAAVYDDHDEDAVQDEIGNLQITEPGEQEARETSATASRRGDGEGEREKGDDEEKNEARPLRVLAIGGAAAELVAFAGYISSANDAGATKPARAEITLLDVGPWGSVVSRLQTALTTAPPLSRYANAASRALVPASAFSSVFVQRDVLSLTREELAGLVAGRDGDDGDESSGPLLITLLFTLNELYTTGGVRRTTSLLRLLSAAAAPGTLLLVVDSPGSYSEAAVGKEAKRYPMQWLLDHTLVPPPPPRRARSGDGGRTDDDGGPDAGGSVRWERLESHDSVWFRVVEGLRYPIPLENMRYQMHLYRAFTG